MSAPRRPSAPPLPCRPLWPLWLLWLLPWAAPAETPPPAPPPMHSTPAGSDPRLIARIVDGEQDFDEWHDLEVELSAVTDEARYLVRRLRVLPSDEVQPDCQDVQRMGRLLLPAQSTTVLPPLELKVSEHHRSAWLTRLLQRQHRRYVVLALELQRLDPTPAAATTASLPPTALTAADGRCLDTVGSDEQQYVWLFATLTVLIDTPPWSMHVGAVLGAMLSTLFVFVSARSGSGPGPDAARRPQLRQLPGELLMTSLACLIAVMLLQSTSSSAAGEAGLPLQVAVKDFYGGLLIGLFGRQIVRFVRRRLNSDADAPETPPAAAPTPPAPATPLPGAEPTVPALPAPGGDAAPRSG